MLTQSMLTTDKDNFLSAEMYEKTELELDEADVIDAMPYVASDIDLLSREGFHGLAQREHNEALMFRARAVAKDLSPQELAGWRSFMACDVSLTKYDQQQMTLPAAKAIIAFRRATGSDDIRVWSSDAAHEPYGLGTMAVGVMTVSESEKYYFPITRWGMRLNSIERATKSYQRSKKLEFARGYLIGTLAVAILYVIGLGVYRLLHHVATSSTTRLIMHNIAADLHKPAAFGPAIPSSWVIAVFIGCIYMVLIGKVLIHIGLKILGIPFVFCGFLPVLMFWISTLYSAMFSVFLR